MLVGKGYSETVLRFNESMPDELLIVQGEVMHYLWGLELTYTNVRKPMNKALEEETRYASGLVAKIILENAMDSSSFEDLMALFEIYPDSAVEFSTYEINVGDISNRNTVFWEVRNY